MGAILRFRQEFVVTSIICSHFNNVRLDMPKALTFKATGLRSSAGLPAGRRTTTYAVRDRQPTSTRHDSGLPWR